MSVTDPEGMILHPPGTVGVPCGIQARYHQFTYSLAKLLKPPNTILHMARGVNIVANCNTLVREMEGEWLWIMGDDHIFNEDILMRLLCHDVDVVVPLCWKKYPPFQLVLYSEREYSEEHQAWGFKPVDPDDLPPTGLMEVYAAGSAGMLIRKHVLDKIGYPWFENTLDRQDEDLLFSEKVIEAGFKIYADVETWLGHIGTFEMWPGRVNDTWGNMMVFDADHQVFFSSQGAKIVGRNS